MKGYANPQLLTHARRAVAGSLPAAERPAARPRPAAAGGLRRRPHPAARAPRSLGRQPDRHRSGAAQGVHVDDRAPLRRPRRRRPTRRSSSTTSSPACARRARSGSSSTSAIRACGCSTAASAPGRAAGLPVTRDAAPPPNERMDRHARGADDRDLARRQATRIGKPDVGDPRHAQRRRVQRHDRPREARRRDSRRRPRRVDAQPDARRRVQAGRASCARCTRMPA